MRAITLIPGQAGSARLDDVPVHQAASECTEIGGSTGLAGLGRNRPMTFDIGKFNRKLVLNNDVIFGSVNVSHMHYDLAVDALPRADPAWLGRLISRRVPLSCWQEAFERRPDDIKTIIDFTL